jgi:hypothetical protein
VFSFIGFFQEWTVPASAGEMIITLALGVIPRLQVSSKAALIDCPIVTVAIFPVQTACLQAVEEPGRHAGNTAAALGGSWLTCAFAAHQLTSPSNRTPTRHPGLLR